MATQDQESITTPSTVPVYIPVVPKEMYNSICTICQFRLTKGGVSTKNIWTLPGCGCHYHSRCLIGLLQCSPQENEPLEEDDQTIKVTCPNCRHLIVRHKPYRVVDYIEDEQEQFDVEDSALPEGYSDLPLGEQWSLLNGALEKVKYDREFLKKVYDDLVEESKILDERHKLQEDMHKRLDDYQRKLAEREKKDYKQATFLFDKELDLNAREHFCIKIERKLDERIERLSEKSARLLDGEQQLLASMERICIKNERLLLLHREWQVERMENLRIKNEEDGFSRTCVQIAEWMARGEL